MSSAAKFIVVIDTSTGGIKEVEEMVRQLDATMDAAFFIVHHVSRKGVGEVLFYRLQHRSPLRQFAKSDFNCPECGGGLYITPPDHPTHYRCHTGHSYTGRELSIRYAEMLETQL